MTTKGQHTPTYRELLIATASDMKDGLLEVQRALACFRDDEPYVYQGRTLTLEEVKYVIVDPLLEELNEQDA